MTFEELTKTIKSKRDGGEVHIKLELCEEVSGNIFELIGNFISSWGFVYHDHAWKEIEAAVAERILIDVLGKGLAYRSQIMPRDEANRLAVEFLKNFSSKKRIFTNLKSPPEMGAWSPITEAAFDTGVLVIDADKVGMLWVEEED